MAPAFLATTVHDGVEESTPGTTVFMGRAKIPADMLRRSPNLGKRSPFFARWIASPEVTLDRQRGCRGFDLTFVYVSPDFAALLLTKAFIDNQQLHTRNAAWASFSAG